MIHIGVYPYAIKYTFKHVVALLNFFSEVVVMRGHKYVSWEIRKAIQETVIATMQSPPCLVQFGPFRAVPVNVLPKW